jgi:hypothetical protein
MVCGRWSVLGAWALLFAGCGGSAPPSADGEALPVAWASCDASRGDEDCWAPGTSALQCRTRDGARHGVCVDDIGNVCASAGDGEAHGCMFDQHCAGWAHGWTRCTDYGAFGPAGCGVCRDW